MKKRHHHTKHFQRKCWCFLHFGFPLEHITHELAVLVMPPGLCQQRLQESAQQVLSNICCVNAEINFIMSRENICVVLEEYWGFLDGSVVKSGLSMLETQETWVGFQGSGRSGVGNGIPRQYSCLGS